MSKLIARTLTRLSVTACAMVALALFGEPLPDRMPSPAPRAAADATTAQPLAAGWMRAVDERLSDDAECRSDASPVEAVSEATGEALARSALRMRWLLTSPSASSRGCGATGCTG